MTWTAGAGAEPRLMIREEEGIKKNDVHAWLSGPVTRRRKSTEAGGRECQILLSAIQATYLLHTKSPGARCVSALSGAEKEAANSS